MDTTVSYVATPAQSRYDIDWEVDPLEELDGKALTNLKLTLVVRGINARHGFTRQNDTNLTLPIYTGMERAVEVSLGDAAFTAPVVAALSDDLTAWTATLDTPEPGEHSVYARAIQDGAVSATVERHFVVTE